MARGNSGAARGQDGQDGGAGEGAGYRVAAGKEAWAEELFATCRRLGLPPDRQGRPNLRALARRIGRTEYTLIARIGSPGDPDLETLRLLERKGGLPRVRSLLALGEITRADLEAELGVAPGSVPDIAPAVRRLMEAWVALPADQARSLLDALRAALGPDFGGNSPGPSPTRADRP